MAKKLTVNKDTCIRCGACTGICPEVLGFDDNGDVDNILGGELPEEYEASAIEAKDSCPVQAIEIED